MPTVIKLKWSMPTFNHICTKIICIDNISSTHSRSYKANISIRFSHAIFISHIFLMQNLILRTEKIPRPDFF